MGPFFPPFLFLGIYCYKKTSKINEKPSHKSRTISSSLKIVSSIFVFLWLARARLSAQAFFLPLILLEIFIRFSISTQCYNGTWTPDTKPEPEANKERFSAHSQLKSNMRKISIFRWWHQHNDTHTAAGERGGLGGGDASHLLMMTPDNCWTPACVSRSQLLATHMVRVRAYSLALLLGGSARNSS